jgi:hypothetical protein
LLWDGNWAICGFQNGDDSGRHQNGELATRIKSAKRITGEERDLDFLNPIGPFAASSIGGQESAIPLLLKGCGCALLEV